VKNSEKTRVRCGRVARFIVGRKRIRARVPLTNLAGYRFLIYLDDRHEYLSCSPELALAPSPLSLPPRHASPLLPSPLLSSPLLSSPLLSSPLLSSPLLSSPPYSPNFKQVLTINRPRHWQRIRCFFGDNSMSDRATGC